MTGAFSARTRALVEARSEGMCELCGHQATEIHHRLPRGMGGTRRDLDRASVALHLCSHCHSFAESHRTWAINHGLLIRGFGEAATHPVHTWRGWEVLDDEGGTCATSN